jgi:hypothetical protein
LLEETPKKVCCLFRVKRVTEILEIHSVEDSGIPTPSKWRVFINIPCIHLGHQKGNARGVRTTPEIKDSSHNII